MNNISSVHCSRSYNIQGQWLSLGSAFLLPYHNMKEGVIWRDTVIADHVRTTSFLTN